MASQHREKVNSMTNIRVDLREPKDVHSKSYIQGSLDKAVKAFQSLEITESGENVTYSEALRRLIVGGLAHRFGHRLLVIDEKGDTWVGTDPKE